MKKFRHVFSGPVLTSGITFLLCSLVLGQVQNSLNAPAIEDILAAKSPSEQTVLVRAALEKWEQGKVVSCLREVPRFRSIFMKSIAGDRFYCPSLFSISASAESLPRERYSRSLLNNKLIAEFTPELGKEGSLFVILLADEDVSVRHNALKLLISLDEQTNRIDLPVVSDKYRFWMNTLLESALQDTDNKIVAEAMRHALQTKASLDMSTIERASQKFNKKHSDDFVRLAAFSYEQEKVTDFFLKLLQADPGRYELILGKLEHILSGPEVAGYVMYNKLQTALSEGTFPYYVLERMLRLLKKCDQYKATEYMLAVILSDKSGKQLRSSESLPNRAASVLVS